MAVGIVSPGAMGSALGAALARSGRQVLATLDGRSPRTRELARRAPFELVPDLAALVTACDVVLSVVPPGSALGTARAIAAAAAQTGHRPLVADLNAIAPDTVQAVAAALGEARLELVDGSISGPPPWQPGTTRVYLSGARAGEIAALALDGVDMRIVGSEVGAASALKMCTASVYKGTALLLTHALVTARIHGVLAEVVDDLSVDFADLLAVADRRIASSAAKAHRYVAEMQEIAATQASAGLTPAVFDAIAEAYDAISRSPAGQATPEEAARAARLDDILAAVSPRTSEPRMA
jgi:3-hydroxyisobutyrate dehydrogenase-like beta-hydroxyacid dehydrogenase